MKKLLMLLLVIPMISFSQVSSWRQTGGNVPASSQTTQSSNVQQSVSQQQNNVSSWRTQTAPIRPGDNFQGQPQQEDLDEIQACLTEVYSTLLSKHEWNG